MSQILPESNDDFSGDFFEVYYVFLAPKLKILGFYRKFKKFFFSKFFIFISKVSQILPEPNDDFSGDFFEVYYLFVVQKLTILENKFYLQLLLITDNCKNLFSYFFIYDTFNVISKLNDNTMSIFLMYITCL